MISTCDKRIDTLQGQQGWGGEMGDHLNGTRVHFRSTDLYVWLNVRYHHPLKLNTVKDKD